MRPRFEVVPVTNGALVARAAACGGQERMGQGRSASHDHDCCCYCCCCSASLILPLLLLAQLLLRLLLLLLLPLPLLLLLAEDHPMGPRPLEGCWWGPVPRQCQPKQHESLS